MERVPIKASKCRVFWGEVGQGGRAVEREATIDFVGHPLFLLAALQALQVSSKKNMDYCQVTSNQLDLLDYSPLKNFTDCESLGISPLMGLAVRMSDKWARLQRFLTEGGLAVETAGDTIHDTLLDLSNYANLMRALLYELGVGVTQHLKQGLATSIPRIMAVGEPQEAETVDTKD